MDIIKCKETSIPRMAGVGDACSPLIIFKMGSLGGAASHAANARSGRTGNKKELVRQEMSNSSATAPTFLRKTG